MRKSDNEGCSKPQDAQASSEAKDLVDTAIAAGNFNTLVKALGASKLAQFKTKELVMFNRTIPPQFAHFRP